MVRKIKKIFYLLIIINNVGFSQTNLVTNGSFENHTTCPNFGGQINYCSNWNNVNLIYGVFTVGTPDYFHTCGSGTTVPPNTFAGQCNPHTGSAMTALVMYNSPFPDYREYISSPLSCPMAVGNTYTVSFWLTNGLNPISKYRIKNIGVHFSSSPLTQSGYSLINVAPQLELTTIVGSTSWVKYTFTINPISSWQHITIGDFRPDSQNSPTSTYSITTGAASVYANYFFDDIEVLSSGSSSSFSATSSVSNIICNGLANGSATLTTTGTGPYSYLWSPGNYTSSVVNNLSPGIYTVSINNGSCNTNTTSVTIIEPSILTSSLTTGSYTICKNDEVILNSNTSGGTPPYSITWNTGSIASSITVTPAVNSVYNFTLTDVNNCVKTESVQIQVESTIASFNNITPSCNSLISFTNTSINSAITFWNFGDGQTSISNSVALNNYASSGIYTISLISSSLYGCKDSIQKIINVNVNYIYLGFDFFVQEFNCLDSVFFINKSIGSTSYLWDFGDGSSSNQISPSHVYNVGVYQANLIGTNSNCIDSLRKEINVSVGNIIPEVNKPNVFTPNGDGINDIFDFHSLANCKDFTFEIFDRWGLLILKSIDNKQNFWDGRTTSGIEVADGTYFYIMNMDNGNKLKGTVTVFR
jgi:gliding motility-associated-like protein